MNKFTVLFIRSKVTILNYRELALKASAVIGGSCVDSLYGDVHEYEHVFAEMMKIKRTFPELVFDEIRNRDALNMNVSSSLTLIDDMFLCSRGSCKSVSFVLLNSSLMYVFCSI